MKKERKGQNLQVPNHCLPPSPSSRRYSLEVVGEDAQVPAIWELDAAEVSLVGGQNVPCPISLRQDHIGGVGNPESRKVIVVVQQVPGTGEVLVSEMFEEVPIPGF